MAVAVPAAEPRGGGPGAGHRQTEAGSLRPTDGSLRPCCDSLVSFRVSPGSVAGSPAPEQVACHPGGLLTEMGFPTLAHGRFPRSPGYVQTGESVPACQCAVAPAGGSPDNAAMRNRRGRCVRQAGRSWRMAVLLLALAGGLAQAAVSVRLTGEPSVGRVLELEINGAPAAENPFDPDQIRLDAVFTLPDGGQLDVPGFWHQPYRRREAGGREVLEPVGEPGWRVRFTPRQPGRHDVKVAFTVAGQPAGGAELAFDVPAPAEAPPAGFARIAADRRYFETSDGQPLPLIGHCVCWHHQRGTGDYEDWFNAMAAAGENYTRLWMAPWAFGIETEPDRLNRYRLDRAWQLDRVFELAFARGIHLMLCFDYHGMFETEPDYWGGNDNWKINPYNAANGGPCATPNDFFTSAEAQALYRKRLRYLVARYGAFSNLLAWQFFNEIDNVYDHLQGGDVARWHAVMGDWLKAHDPWGHLVTTSLTGGSERPEIWRLPQMDFAMYHSYGQTDPADALPRIVARFLDRYDKPVMVGEFGTDWRGWRREQDPHLRGWRQGIWAGVLGGAVGNSMSWWWEAIHQENLYPTFTALKQFLGRSTFPRGGWEPIRFPPRTDPPDEVGDPLPGGEPFDVQLPLDRSWGAANRGSLAVGDPSAAESSARLLNAFVHGTGHPELRRPFRLSAWLGEGARLVLHVNSVSEGAVVSVLVDGNEVFRRPLPNRDGQPKVNGEYDLDLPVGLPAGRRVIEIRNAGGDWFNLDWVRLERVLPAALAGGWQPVPIACGLKGPGELLLYVVNPAVSFPAGATAPEPPPLRDGRLTVPGVPAGRYRVTWVRPADNATLGSAEVEAVDGSLELPLPGFVEDLAAHLARTGLVRLESPRRLPGKGLAFEVQSPLPGPCTILASETLSEWAEVRRFDHTGGSLTVEAPIEGVQRFFRARFGNGTEQR
ncbi:MAG: DUF5060 domain-containing protein [Verrucomicrobia bacterium]|nr:MAG: DUF5060 domain-containing protein [Verrucomicrobiota bacterium]